MAEEKKLGQAPLGCRGVDCSLTTINDATDSATDSATDPVDHATNGIGGTPHDAANCVSDTSDNTTLRSKISTSSEYPALSHPMRRHDGREITYNGIQGPRSGGAGGRGTSSAVGARGTSKQATNGVKLALLAAREAARDSSEKAGLRARYLAYVQGPLGQKGRTRLTTGSRRPPAPPAAPEDEASAALPVPVAPPRRPPTASSWRSCTLTTGAASAAAARAAMMAILGYILCVGETECVFCLKMKYKSQTWNDRNRKS